MARRKTNHQYSFNIALNTGLRGVNIATLGIQPLTTMSSFTDVYRRARGTVVVDPSRIFILPVNNL